MNPNPHISHNDETVDDWLDDSYGPDYPSDDLIKEVDGDIVGDDAPWDGHYNTIQCNRRDYDYYPIPYNYGGVANHNIIRLLPLTIVLPVDFSHVLVLTLLIQLNLPTPKLISYIVDIVTIE